MQPSRHALSLLPAYRWNVGLKELMQKVPLIWDLHKHRERAKSIYLFITVINVHFEQGFHSVPKATSVKRESSRKVQASRLLFGKILLTVIYPSPCSLYNMDWQGFPSFGFLDIHFEGRNRPHSQWTFMSVCTSIRLCAALTYWCVCTCVYFAGHYPVQLAPAC